MADLYRAIMLNTVTGASNPAIVDFSTQNGSDPGTAAAGILAYLGALGVAGVFGGSTSVFGIDYRANGASGSLPVSFPTADYATLEAANTGDIPAWTAYSTSMGSGALEAIGTAVTVSLYTLTPGRKTTGRHYLPFIGEALNDGNGRLVSTAPGQIEQAYTSFIHGIDTSTYTGLVNLNAVVHSATAGDTLIATPKVSRNFSRLKTRTR